MLIMVLWSQKWLQSGQWEGMWLLNFWIRPPTPGAQITFPNPQPLKQLSCFISDIHLPANQPSTCFSSYFQILGQILPSFTTSHKKMQGLQH